MREVRRRRAEAAIAAAEGDPSRAAALLQANGEFAKSTGLREELLWNRLDLGRTLIGVDPAAAVRALIDAARLAEEMAATTQLRLASQKLRQLGVRAWRRGGTARGSGFPALSAREIEVARLVASGSSNRETAATLRISPRTVDHHVANIFAKVGVRNRTELASAMRSEPLVGSSSDDLIVSRT
jgi:DNA-binding CsgD family transcriptional regulator